MNAFAKFRQATKAPAPIQPAEAVRRAKAGEITVIDVRGHDEVAATGKAEGALHIPLMLVSTKADPRHPEFHPELDTGKPVAVYCASGARSQAAGQMLLQYGFDQVFNIGGFGDWSAAGGPVAR